MVQIDITDAAGEAVGEVAEGGVYTVWLTPCTLLDPARVNSTLRALVVGVNSYQGPFGPLYNCVRDAVEVASVLQRGGYRVACCPDATRASITRALSLLQRGAGGVTAADPVTKPSVMDRLMVLYFSGHGYYADGSNLLVPADAENLGKGGVCVCR